MIIMAVACTCCTTLLAGCGEQLSSEALKAVEQVKVDSEKLAIKKADSLKAAALGQLTGLLGGKRDPNAAEQRREEPAADKPGGIPDAKDGSASH
jgi:hypothetical protein